MTKYRVRVENLYQFEIEADSPMHARDIVFDMSDEDFNAGYVECSHYETEELIEDNDNV